MAKTFISNKDESVRMFKSDFLEFFSHIHWSVPVIAWSPVIIGLFIYCAMAEGILATLGFFIAGVFLWSLSEYILHRFVFHYQPKTEVGKKLHFLLHGVHHDYPQDSSRLVMPLGFSVPIAIVFYFVFRIIMMPLGGEYYLGLFSGFIAGYLAYDMIHYATHHMPMRGRIGKFLKQYHMKHHYVDGDHGYGVSNPLWDHVFHTVPKK
ncbi:hypothetical protein BH10BAC6_BH10BAC6_10300 [soil metagenome]